MCEHDWAVRVRVFANEQENFWTKRRERFWAATVEGFGNDGVHDAITTEMGSIFCVRPGCGVKVSDVLAAVTA